MSFFTRILDAVFNRHPATEWSPTRSHIWHGYDDARKDLCASDRKELQRLARYFESCSAIVNRMADLWECYVVGAQGLQIFPASSSEDWNNRALTQFNLWKPFADIASREGWDTSQGRIVRSWFVDGEVFVILTKEGPFSRIQLVEAHRCLSPDGERPNVHDGVEVDANGRPIAYWFRVGDTEKITPIDASYVVHIFEPSRPGQLRGIPLISCVLNDLRDLSDLQILEMRAAKQSARIVSIRAR
jgi:capsid protein